jgi:hypothetical protein
LAGCIHGRTRAATHLGQGTEVDATRLESIALSEPHEQAIALLTSLAIIPPLFLLGLPSPIKLCLLRTAALFLGSHGVLCGCCLIARGLVCSALANEAAYKTGSGSDSCRNYFFGHGAASFTLTA